jgi:hypothetical protein
VNHRRILIGLIAWFLGIIVLVYHHVALHAAIAAQPSSNDITRMRWVWEFLPWVDWLYLTVMWLVGTILIISGMLGARSPRQREWKQKGPRGFEVTPVNSSQVNEQSV